MHALLDRGRQPPLIGDFLHGRVEDVPDVAIGRREVSRSNGWMLVGMATQRAADRPRFPAVVVDAPIRAHVVVRIQNLKVVIRLRILKLRY